MLLIWMSDVQNNSGGFFFCFVSLLLVKLMKWLFSLINAIQGKKSAPNILFQLMCFLKMLCLAPRSLKHKMLLFAPEITPSTLTFLQTSQSLSNICRKSGRQSGYSLADLMTCLILARLLPSQMFSSFNQRNPHSSKIPRGCLMGHVCKDAQKV